MSRGLISRIFKHALSEAWINPGDVVVDCFGGIGSTGIIGAYMGLRVVCVELEEKFVDLGRQNFGLHQGKIAAFNHLGHSYQPQIIQGDSRKLSEVIYAQGIAGADCLVGSPPFAEAQTGGGINKKGYHNEAHRKGVFDLVGKRSYTPENQGTTEGNLAAMKPGSVEAIVSSPPFQETVSQQDPEGIKGQNLKERANPRHPGEKIYFTKYAKQDTPGNLGNLKPGEVEAIISSPPFENSLESKDMAFREKATPGRINKCSDYGDTAGNIGNDKGETFWQAARQIVSECHKILKPGGHTIWVVKAFVRKGAIVDFPGDWRLLCESQGFTTVCVHHAMLVKETRTNGLFEEIVETKERKSFFRRLAEKKGSPKIDYEVVLCMKKVNSAYK